jgi:[protein-PII] uridylyltransferase
MSSSDVSAASSLFVDDAQGQQTALAWLASVDWLSTPRSEIAKALKSHREVRLRSLQKRVADGGEGGGLEACEAYAHVMDELVQVAFIGTNGVGSSSRHPMAVAAVGSYARRTLSLASDVDIRFLVPGAAEQSRGAVEAILYPLWDAGIDVGHQIVEEHGSLELALTDLPTATSLLDWRFLVGDQSRSTLYQERVHREVFGAAQLSSFLETLARSVEQRRARFGDSVFLLEPDLKSGAGGLRDLDVLSWAAKARWRVPHFSELVDIGVMLPAEGDALHRALGFVLRVRNTLHAGNRKRQDRLGFAEQRWVAKRLGYGDGATAIEAFMSDYYRHAKTIESASERVLRRALPKGRSQPVTVTPEGFAVDESSVGIVDIDRIHTQPALALACYLEAASRGLAVAEITRQSIFRACATPRFSSQMSNNADAMQSFRRLLVWDAPTPAFRHGSIVRELRDVGLLQVMIPEFSAILGRVQHDAHHVYTVDVHSLVTVDTIRRLRSNHHDEQPYAREVANRVAVPESLYWAALLHDVGKEVEGRGHAERGAILARAVVARFGLLESECQRIESLIRHHLRMYLFAFRRDLTDVRTIERFAALVPDARALDDLYVLSYADVVATSPSSVNDWKLQMLEELHHFASGWMREALSPETMVSSRVPSLTHTLAKLQADTDGCKWTFRVLDVGNGVARIVFLGDDGAGLLAKIAAVFAVRKVKILTAQIQSHVTATRARVCNVFTMQTGFDELRLERECRQYEADFAAIQATPGEPRRYLEASLKDARWSARELPQIPLRVRIDNRDAPEHTILEVITNDRADVMFWVSDCLFRMGLGIDRAKVHVEGARVTQVFYLRYFSGAKVEGKVAEAQLVQAVHDALVGGLGLELAQE